MDRLTDDVLYIVHAYCAHRCMEHGCEVWCDGRGPHHHCHCALSKANRHLRHLFRFEMLRVPVLASSIPALVAAHARVREVKLVVDDDTPDEEWSLLRYLQNAPRLRRLTVVCEDMYTPWKAFHLGCLADLLPTLPHRGFTTK